MKTIHRFFLLALLVATTSVTALAQTTVPEYTKKSDAVQLKMRQNAILTQLTPLLLDKPQLSGLLSELERIKDKMEKIYASEAKTLEALEPDVDKSISNAIDRGVYPSKETQAKINKAVQSMQINRALESGKMIESLLIFIKKNFNEGQIKCMRGSFEPEFIDPINKGKNLKDDEKVAFFIRFIFLDSATYDVVLRMYKAKAA